MGYIIEISVPVCNTVAQVGGPGPSCRAADTHSGCADPWGICPGGTVLTSQEQPYSHTQVPPLELLRGSQRWDLPPLPPPPLEPAPCPGCACFPPCTGRLPPSALVSSGCRTLVLFVSCLSGVTALFCLYPTL